jgi:hypothetical protein
MALRMGSRAPRIEQYPHSTKVTLRSMPPDSKSASHAIS